MNFYAHRGNFNGPNLSENDPSYIDDCIAAGYLAEVDLWGVGNVLFLGHDFPQYLVSDDWLCSRAESLLVHAKNTRAASFLSNSINPVFHFFSHQKDSFTVTSNGLLWVHDLSLISPGCIAPLLSKELLFAVSRRDIHICSDYDPNLITAKP